MKINAEVKKQTRLQGLGAGVVMRVKTNKFNSHDRYVMCVQSKKEWLLIDLELGNVWKTVESAELKDMLEWIHEFNRREGHSISVCELAEMKVTSYE